VDRREFLVAWLQALFLTLFPWLRNERGLGVARKAAEQYLYTVPTSPDIWTEADLSLGTWERVAMEHFAKSYRLHRAPQWRFADVDVNWKLTERT
jgi:hypothetical protein